VYYSQCAGDGRTELASALVQARPRAREQSSRAAAAGSHTVRRGDTLAGIARRYGCGGTSALARANGISGPNYLIRPGQRIQLVNCRG
jgi:membrane-bound lytic murein transglycosylase D